MRPYLQNNQNKMDWRYGSSEHVLCKHKALSFNPSPTTKEKNLNLKNLMLQGIYNPST
jgi:hypothetical protein